MRIRAKVQFISVGAVLLLGALFLVVFTIALNVQTENRVTDTRNLLLQEKKAMLKSVIDIGYSVIERNYNDFQSSGLSSLKKMYQDQAKKELSALTYGEDGYFFVYDSRGRRLVDPVGGGIGKSFLDVQDKTGKFVIKELIDAGESGEGFVEYVWHKQSLGREAAKLSFAKGFQPWGWVLGTGLYVDDVDTEIANIEHDAIAQKKQIFGFAISILILFIVAFSIIAIWVGERIAKPLQQVNALFQELSQGEGDLTKRLEMKNKDEIGELALAFNVFMDKLHEIISAIKENSLLVASSSERIGVSMSQVGSTIERQASTTQQISATITELSANADEVAANSGQASANVTQISRTVQDLKQSIEYLGNQFEQLNKQSSHVLASTQDGVASIEENDRIIRQMANSSEIISDRIDAVTDIAEQIKLLALNAAIVAAQAGEHGRGFSVVADAINGLAQQAGKTADEITKMVRENVNIAQKGLDISQQTRAVMQSIADQSDQSNQITQEVTQRVQEQVVAGNEIALAAGDSAHRVEQVSNAMHEQTRAVGQVTEAVEELAQIAMQTAASVEEISGSNNDLQKVANHLKDMVDRFRLEKGKSSGLKIRS